MPKQDLFSVQSEGENVKPQVAGLTFPITFFSASDVAPGWDSGDRDVFLRKFWKQFGNDILQAFLAVSIAKVQTQNWSLEGPEQMVDLYRKIIRDDSDFGRGYSSLAARGVQDYYTQDNGWFMERRRASADDFEGPCLGLAHIDSARMYPTGNQEFPYSYKDVFGKLHLMHNSQFIRIVDMPSPVSQLNYHEKGFCALSRALSTAMVLSLLVAMKREKLSDLPPSALAVFNNINKKQFDTALQLHTLQEDSKGNMVWRSLLPLFGIDPAHPADVKFISLREVWEGFDEMTAYNVAVYSFAAAWRMDPREVWPVSSGPLGTGKESEIQHEKAKSKSFGLLFTEVERQFNSELTLPKDVAFKLQIEDSEEELLQAQIHSTQISNVKAMQEAGANLTPVEVRHMLAVAYHILPRSMKKLPKEVQDQLAAQNQAQTAPQDQRSGNVSTDDVARQSKEYGMYFGPRAGVYMDGKKEYLCEEDQVQGLYRLARAYKQADSSVSRFLQSRIHSSFTQAADDLYALGYLTTEQRIALSGMIGDALEKFASSVADGLQDLDLEHDDAVFIMSKEIGKKLAVITDAEQVISATKAIIQADVSEIPPEKLAERIKKLPRAKRQEIADMASKIRSVLSPTSRLSVLESIPVEDWQAAQEQDEGAKNETQS